MDSSLITLLNQKKTVLKTQSLRASELIFNKSLKTDSNVTCNRLICDVIEINPGTRQELKEVDITESSINSTDIGLEEPSVANFSKLEIKSFSSPEDSFKTDGDIHISGTFLDIERQLKSDNPFKLNMLSTLTLQSNDEMILDSSQNLKLKSLKSIYLNSNVSMDINTKQLNIYSKIFSNDTTDSSNSNNGSIIVKGGLGINKNLCVGGNINILNPTENCLFLHGGMYIKKNINIEGSINVKDTDTNNLNVGGSAFIIKNMNIYEHLNVLGNNINSTIINGGIIIKKNINTYDNLIVNKNTIIKDSLNVFKNTIIQKNLNVLNDSTINNNLNVLNDSTIHKNLNVLSDSTIHKNLNVLSDSTIHNNLNILNDSTINNNLNVKGIIIANTGLKSANLNLFNNQIYSITNEISFNNNNLKNINNININNINISGILESKIGNPNIEFNKLHNNINLSPQLLIPNAFQKIDEWLNERLVDTPPSPLNTNNQIIISEESISFDWIFPIQYEIGFLNQKLPHIVSLGIDYKKSIESNYNSLIINDININRLKIYAFNYTNYIENNNYHLFGIEKETNYDFRIYYTNHNTKNNFKYLYFNNLKTLNSTLPQTINNIIFQNINTNSINLNWSHPISNSKISSYMIMYNSISSLKYPNFQNDNKIIFSNTNNILNNANNYIFISNLLKGHDYEIKIKTKTRINNDYNHFSNINNFTTNLNTLNFNINNNNLFIINNNNYIFNNRNYGYSLDGNNIINNLYDYNKLDNNISSNILENLRINENIGSTKLITSTLNCKLNNFQNNLNLGGFGRNNIINDITNNINILILKENNNDGFFKTSDIQININKNILNPSNIKKELEINQYLPFSQKNYKSKTYNFYIEKMSNVATLSNLNTSLLDYKLDYISGVPIVIESNLNVNVISHNLTNNFLRHDKKHLELLFINNNNNNIFQNKLNITNDYIKNYNNYYNINGSIHNDGQSILRNTNDLLFKNLIVKLNSNNIGYNEKLKLGIYTFNLYGKSDLNRFDLDEKIRIDYNSIIVKNNNNNSNNNLGQHVFSGGNIEYPYIYTLETNKYNKDLNNLSIINNNNFYNYNNVLNNIINYNNNINLIKNIALEMKYNLNLLNNNNILINFNINKDKISKLYFEYNNNLNNVKLFGNNYNHNINIKKMNELQLINGYYKNLENVNYNVNNNLIVYPNYNVTDLNLYNKDIYDYMTLKYDNIINNTNKITIEFIDSKNLNNNDLSVMIKIVNYENSDYNTGWLNVNKYISMLGINDYNKKINNTGILSIYKKESNLTKKYCYLPNGSKGILYLRVGIKKNSNIKIKYIRVLDGFI